MNQRKYYEAYDERYQTAHRQNIRWFGDVHSASFQKHWKSLCPEYADRFQELDCVCGSLEGRFDFIYDVCCGEKAEKSGRCFAAEITGNGSKRR